MSDRAVTATSDATALVGRPATEIAEVVRSGAADAVDVVRAHLDHLAAVEHRLGAYVSVLRRQALEEAAALDAHPERGSLPLAGVPVAIKDIVDVEGLPTLHGSQALPGRLAPQDHDLVARLRAAGAVIVGKTRCPELSLWGSSDDSNGAAVAPWDPSRTAGGSSGGSAAAVSAGTVPLALASDGLGSVRIPAGCNGLVGIKPGAGLLPVELPSGEAHWFGMSRYGPLATTVADVALGLATLSGRHELAEVATPSRPLRVAVSVKSPAAGVVVTRPWVDAAMEAGRLLRHAGHDVARADPPYDPATVVAVTARWLQGATLDVQAFDADPAALQPRTRAHANAGRRMAKVVPVREAQALRWRERVAPFFEEHDVLLTPLFARRPLAARAWHRASWATNVAANLAAYPFPSPWNLADQPAAAVPIGGDGGPPLAVQVVAAQGREDLVLAVAAQLESLAPWRRHPPGWQLPTD